MQRYKKNCILQTQNEDFIKERSEGKVIIRISITSVGRDFCFARHNQSKTLFLLSLIAKIRICFVYPSYMVGLSYEEGCCWVGNRECDNFLYFFANNSFFINLFL